VCIWFLIYSSSKCKCETQKKNTIWLFKMPQTLTQNLACLCKMNKVSTKWDFWMAKGFNVYTNIYGCKDLGVPPCSINGGK
jgi:hypothetical protein